MLIAGGLYKEFCYVPEWSREFGSGGRAASALNGLCEEIELHTYSWKDDSTVVEGLRNNGVEVYTTRSDTEIVFVYFHPLSTPHIEPPLHTLKELPVLEISSSAVLRFGFLEGDAVVTADRAVYDPQTSKAGPAFHDNGSQADQLAIVLNANEVKKMSGIDDIDRAANAVMNYDQASVVIVKDGIRGATLYQENSLKQHIPAYMSNHVFKIGTGDIFSAMFAFHWAELKKNAVESANLASQAVARYCNDGKLPIALGEDDKITQVEGEQYEPVLVDGLSNTLSRRYVLEESCARLRELGIDFICPSIEASNYGATRDISAIYLIADRMSAELEIKINHAEKADVPVVVFREAGDWDVSPKVDCANFRFFDDFTTSIYHAGWAAMR